MKNNHSIVDKEKLKTKNFKTVLVKDIAEKIQYGYTGKSIDKGEYKYLRITDIQNNHVDWESVPFSDIQGKEEIEKYKLKPNDIVFARTGATVGKSFLIEEVENSVFASYLIRIVPKPQVYPKFLQYFFQSDDYWAQIRGHEVGAAQPNVNGKKLGKLKVPLPPLPEQRRIVSKLDALFAEIDASLALIDQNIEQAEALKLSVLDEEFSKIKEKENIYKIQEIAFTKSGATPRRSNKKYWNGDIPWLKSGELNDNKNIIQNTEFITQKGLDNSSAKLFPKGTLLMAMYGATAGKLGILGMEACTNQAVCSIQNNKDFFVEEYLFYYLLMIREQIILDSFGGAQPNISKRYIDNLEVPFPENKETQQKIVQKLDSLFEEIDGLISDYQQKREDLEALKSSLLDRAFKGEL